MRNLLSSTAIVLLWFLFLVSSATAQQVCYSYDGLGRLTGVIDQNNQAAFYDYDAVGNILAIRRQSPSGPVTIYSFDPASGAAGGSVEIFGIGFGAAADQNQVMIGGTPATVVSTLPCTLVAQIPANASSGQITVISPLGQATSSQTFLVSALVIGGTGGAVLPNGTIQFSATTNGCSDPTLIWRVNGIIGGNSIVGTIDAAGLYTAPAVIPQPPTVTVRADSVGCTGLFSEATLTIVSQITGFVFASASANFNAPAPIFPPGTILHAASANYGGLSAEGAPNAFFHAASIANVPVITAMSPSSAARGANFNITISGINLTGASGLSFLGASAPDTAITVTNIVANGPGTALSANVSILSTATTGARTVRIDHPAGNSTAGNTTVNIFTIMP